MIDGTNTLMPVNAEQLGDELYIILNDEQYADPDPSVLIKFYPGDIVEVDNSETLDNKYQFAAKPLIQADTSEYPEL